VPTAASAFSGVPGVITALLAIVTVLVGLASFYYNSASATKKTRLESGLAAYRAAMAWRWLAESAIERRGGDVEDIRGRLMQTKENVAYYEAYMYGESQGLGALYHFFCEAISAACEPSITVALSEVPSGRTVESALQPRLDHSLYNEQRRAFLVELKRTASYYRVLRRLRLKKALAGTPDWL